MAGPDSRKQVGGICFAKAEAVSHDAERICGAGIGKMWLPGAALEAINHRSDNAKQATAHIRAKCKVGNKEVEKSVPLQSLKAQPQEGAAACATAAEAGVLTNDENENPNSNNGAPPAADSPAAGSSTTATTTSLLPPLGGGNNTSINLGWHCCNSANTGRIFKWWMFMALW